MTTTIKISPQALRLALAADRVIRVIDWPLRRLQAAWLRAGRRRRADQRRQVGMRLLAGVVR